MSRVKAKNLCIAVAMVRFFNEEMAQNIPRITRRFRLDLTLVVGYPTTSASGNSNRQST